MCPRTRSRVTTCSITAWPPRTPRPRCPTRRSGSILAAVLHDIGKPATSAAGHFIGHAEEGARMARVVLRRLRISHTEAAEVAHLIREHMFQYQSEWTDAAVRRFLRRVGPGHIDDLLRLRQADNIGSGQQADVDFLPELRARLHAQRESTRPAPCRGPGRRWQRHRGDHGPATRTVGRGDAGAAARIGGQRPHPEPTGGATRGCPAVAVGRRSPGMTPSTLVPVASGAMIEMLLQADRLLNVDMVDQAQATYQRVVDQDPGMRSRSWASPGVRWPGAMTRVRMRSRRGRSPWTPRMTWRDAWRHAWRRC